jgi:pentatricopeptide repeat protein
LLGSGKLRGALDLFEEMEKAGVEPSLQTYCTLISVFEKTGEINKAAAVFKAIRETEQGADEMAFSHMIHCYGTAGCSPLPHLFISDLLP